MARVGVAKRTLVQSPNQILLPLLTDSWDPNSLLIRISIDLCFLQLQISELMFIYPMRLELIYIWPFILKHNHVHYHTERCDGCQKSLSIISVIDYQNVRQGFSSFGILISPCANLDKRFSMHDFWDLWVYNLFDPHNCLLCWQANAQTSPNPCLIFFHPLHASQRGEELRQKVGARNHSMKLTAEL